MPMSAQCPACGNTLPASRRLAGKPVRCPKCSATVNSPKAPTVEEEYGFTGEPDSASATKKLYPVVNVTIMASSPPPTGTINVPCPTCGTVLKARASAAGRTARCSSCGGVLTVPEHRTKVDGIEEHGPAKASGSSSAVAKPTRTITVVCPACGKTLRAPASAAGKKAKCPQCGKPVLVPVGSPQMPAAGVPQVPGVGFPQPVPSIYNDDDFAPAGSSAYGLTASAPTSAEPERTACPKCGEMIVRGAAKCPHCKAIFDGSPRRAAKKKRTASSSGSNLRTIGGGLLAMVGAVIWFVVGWFCGYIFFYPPILFIGGLITLVRGLAKSASGRD